MSASLSLRALALGMVLCLAWPTLAQTEEREPSTGYGAIIDNIDLLVDNYAKFLGRKYDLTEEQDEYTKFLLRERAYEFLDKHEDDLRGLVDRLFEVRTGADMTPEELIEWGRQATPLYEEAKKLIVDGNAEWREILTPEQQSIHDKDLKLMEESFETTDEQLNRIVSGEMTIDEFRSPKRGRRSSRSRARQPEPRGTPKLPPPPEEAEITPNASSPEVPGDVEPAERRHGKAADPAKRMTKRERDRDRTEKPGSKPKSPRASNRPPRVDRSGRASGRPDERPDRGDKKDTQKPESAWERYVREFIEKYALNDEQTQKARAVLEDCQAQAERYTIGHKSRMEELDQQISELKKSKGKGKDKDKDKNKRLAELNRQRDELAAPIDQIFERQLKPRLERLPTRAQRRAAEAAARKKPADKEGKPSPKKPAEKPTGEKDD